jgi:HAD superfamily hydrolase (TIGR01484 family)
MPTTSEKISPKKVSAARNVSLPRVVMFDADNTLAKSKQPLEKEMAMLFATLSTKTNVAVISGGKLEQLIEQVAQQLPPSADLGRVYILPTSGAALYTYEEHEWIKVYEEEIEIDEADRVEELVSSAVAETGIVDCDVQAHGERIEYRGSEISFSALGQNSPLDEKEAWDPDRTKRTKLQTVLANLLPEYDVKIGGLTTIDITKHGINKAYGIRKLAEYLEIPISEMLYIGDALYPGGNDEVVKETSIATHAVENPDDTLAFLHKILLKGYSRNAEVSIEKKSYEPSPAKKVSAPASVPSAGAEISDLQKHIAVSIRGDVSSTDAEREKYSKDTSLFTRTPSMVVYPKDAHDVSELVKAVRDAKLQGHDVSVTGRSAGTDMSGGPLTTSVVAVFMKYMNKILAVGNGYAVTEPGVFYRDFEKATLAKEVNGLGQILPSYPASRELCAMGGIVNNNSGGERTLEYGKTEDYIEEVEVVLSDGSLTTFKALSKSELAEKKALQTFEGEIYRKMSALVERNGPLILSAKPHVSKNSAGYALWNIVDPKRGTFNLAKLICGAQGTLALMTKARLRLIQEENHRAMLVIFLQDINVLPEIVRRVLPFNPESFESYDDNTFKLAVKFLPQMLGQMGLLRATRLGISFLPEVMMAVTGGIPKLVLMAEFSAKTSEQALKKAEQAHAALREMQMPAGEHLPMSIKRNEQQSEKYWIVRRESFALLRKSIKGMYASPFIDDFVVPPDSYPTFLPELNALLAQYDKYFIYTIAGHIGNGNFHIIPLMDLKKPDSKRVVLELAPKVYELVIKYGGTTTGEHNDGIIRTPYLPMLFGDKVMALFKETKDIFDPLNIFNPGKKIGGTFADIDRDMLKSS